MNAAARARARLLVVLLVVGLVVTGHTSSSTAPAYAAAAAAATPGLPRAEPGEVGLSADRLERLTAYMEGVVAENLLPGSVTLVARQGRVAHVEVEGVMDADGDVELQRHSLFRMYSMTKPITTVAILILMEEGRLLLDDPVADHIPAFAGVQVQQGDDLVPPERPPTIRDLLTHTSGTVGLTEALNTPGLVELDAVSPMSVIVDRIAEIPLRFQPGTRFEYGFGHDIAGVIVENVSGMTLDEFFRERIFEPLRMPDTAFYVPDDEASRLVPELMPTPQGDTWDWIPAGPRIYSSDKTGQPQEHFGGGGWGGGVVSTIDDYSRFAQMLLNGGELDGAEVLSRKSVEMMTTPHTGNLLTTAGPGYAWGLGVSVRTDLTSVPVLGSVGRFGWSGAGFTYFFVDPAEDLLAIRFANVLDRAPVPGLGDLNAVFDTLVYQAVE